MSALCVRTALLSAAIIGFGFACASRRPNPEPKPEPVPATVSVAASVPVVAPTTAASAAPKEPAPMTVQLSGDVPQHFAEQKLSAQITGASHKTRAPRVSVTVSFAEIGGRMMADVTWWIDRGEMTGVWHPIASRRYDRPSDTYIDEAIAGWEVRLDSIDDASVGGNPTAVTMTARRVAP